MELILHWVVRWIVWPVAAPFVKAWRRRQIRELERYAPPRGTRPVVRLEHDGVTYDLTEFLLRAKDDAHGCAVWVVIGPEHLRFTTPDVNLHVEQPVPKDTHLVVEMCDVPPRFRTKEELMDMLEEIE